MERFKQKIASTLIFLNLLCPVNAAAGPADDIDKNLKKLDEIQKQLDGLDKFQEPSFLMLWARCAYNEGRQQDAIEIWIKLASEGNETAKYVLFLLYGEKCALK